MNTGESLTGIMTALVFQVGLIIFVVRLGGRPAKRLGIPPALGALVGGILIGPYALGGIGLPGFPQGIFPLGPLGPLGTGIQGVSQELYALAVAASIILFFASGLETELGLFFRYSLAGGVIGIGGTAASFVFGALAGVFLLHLPFLDPRCLFLGVLATASSAGVSARTLSYQKKMDSPEGVTILAAAVFDNLLGITGLAAVLGIAALQGRGGHFSGTEILLGAGKAAGIWLGVVILGLIFSKKIAAFLKIFKRPFDVSILALGFALLLAGFFEKQGLAMITGAYAAGLSLAGTGIAAVVRKRIRGLYVFFVPFFFAVMGMMVNLREVFVPPALIFAVVYTVAAAAAKMIGCGGPALLLGFNLRGGLRIGAGMLPRWEAALIIAGIGLASGVLDTRLFGGIVLMILCTSLAAPPLLRAAFRLPGPGTRKPVKGDGPVTAEYEFVSDEIAGLVVDTLHRDLRAGGFYVQMVNIADGLSQARKDDIALSITGEGSTVTIETGRDDMPFVKKAVYEVILALSEGIQKLKDSADPRAVRQDPADKGGRTPGDLLSHISPDTIIPALKGETKEEVIAELVDILAAQGKIQSRDEVLRDVLQREVIMSTGMQHGIALPHAKTGGTRALAAAVGIKGEGVDFDSVDGEPSRLFILLVSPKNESGPHIQFLAAIGAVLQDGALRERVINAVTREEIAALLRGKSGE